MRIALSLTFLLPIVFQLMYGKKAIISSISLKFSYVCLISGLGQVLITTINIYVMNHSGALIEGMAEIGMIAIGKIFLFIDIIIMIVQYFKFRQRISK